MREKKIITCDICHREVDKFVNCASATYPTIYKIKKETWHGNQIELDICGVCQTKLGKLFRWRWPE